MRFQILFYIFYLWLGEKIIIWLEYFFSNIPIPLDEKKNIDSKVPAGRGYVIVPWRLIHFKMVVSIGWWTKSFSGKMVGNHHFHPFKTDCLIDEGPQFQCLPEPNFVNPRGSDFRASFEDGSDNKIRKSQLPQSWVLGVVFVFFWERMPQKLNGRC